jgi:hypothetical protein
VNLFYVLLKKKSNHLGLGFQFLKDTNLSKLFESLTDRPVYNKLILPLKRRLELKYLRSY